MRAVEGFHVEWVKDEAVLLDPESGQMHYLNPPAAYVYALIQEYGFDVAMKRLEDGFDANAGIRRELGPLLDDMVAKGLLVNES